MLSLIYTCYNRAGHFRPALTSLARQTLPRDEYEIIVVDDGSTDNLVELLTTAREAHGLPIRYCRIALDSLLWPIYRYEGANNPAPALNVGIRAARGERIVLTSPEVEPKHIATLDRIDGWPLEPHQALVADVWDPGMQHHPQLRGWISGGPNHRVLHFFGTFSREFAVKMGAFEERFTVGWGFEDTEFCSRFIKNGGEYLFSGQAVSAWHHEHPRVEDKTIDGVAAARELCDRLTDDPGFLVANPDHEWGNDALVVETRWWDG
jgi:glycosyltransferase involved in cell wall biosynthesis